MKAYLAGAITGDGDPKTWRQQATLTLAPEVLVTGPVVYDKAPDGAYVVPMDIDLIDHANIVIANVERPSWGTAMEIFHSFMAGRPVYAFPDQPEGRSPWLTYHVSRFFPNLEAAIAAVKEYAYE